MSRVLAYTGPSEGHLYPLVPTLIELDERGHEVAVRTMAKEIPRLREMGFETSPVGFETSPVADGIAEPEADDWRGRTPIGALRRRVQQFVERAPLEMEDLESAIAESQPDVLLVDPTAWGAAIAAEASGLPFAFFAHSPLPISSKDAPPFVLGLPPARGPLGRLRDRVAERAVLRPLEQMAIPKMNRLRAERGLVPLRDSTDFALTAHRFLYYSAEPFEYPRTDWPESVRLVGPGLWEPPAQEPTWLDDLPRPLVLVTCSTEFQNDRKIVEVAIEAFGNTEMGVVVTTGSVEFDGPPPPPNVRLERYVPHTPVIRQASCVVCHGGMGITQKALAHGVPVCVIPFGRDQPEVARRVRVANAGTSIIPGRLSPPRLKRAVAYAISRTAGAEAIASAFASAGGPGRAAAEIEQLVPSSASAPRFPTSLA